MFNLFKDPIIEITIFGDDEAKKLLQKFSTLDYPAFIDPDEINGKIIIEPQPKKSLSHKGIEITVFGEYRKKNGDPLHRFFSRKQIIAPEGRLTEQFVTDFSVKNIKIPTATYYGPSVDAVFGVEVRIIRLISDFIKNAQFIILNYSPTPYNTPLHSEIGISNIIHLEFVFPKKTYDCRECICGAVYFIIVKMRIVKLSFELICRESFDINVIDYAKKIQIKEYEFLDGSPVRGDHIPIRIYLSELNIWPYTAYAGSALQVQYYLRAQIVTENGQQFFKRAKIQFERYLP